MGYLRPTAMIVTGHYPRRLDVPDAEDHWADHARDKALEIFGRRDLAYLVTEAVGEMNNERSFLVAWDGSKEGWQLSDHADEARAEFIEWLRAQAYEDGSGPCDWVELQYGGDDNEVIVLAYADDSRVPA